MLLADSDSLNHHSNYINQLIQKKMKTLKNLRTIMLITALAVGFTSCQKSELNETESTENINQEEGFRSVTGNSDSEVEEISKEKPIYHVTYKGNLTSEEAEARFEKDAAKFMAEYKKSHRGVSTEWFYRIATRTGTQTHNDTDADVYGRVTFQTDKGFRNPGWVELDNFGNDRERGDWDFYIFRATYPGQAVSWVEAECAQLALRGTDGWFVTRFYAQVYTSIQTLPSTGYSRIISSPNVWLDNASSSGWDYYTNCSDIGRLNF